MAIQVIAIRKDHGNHQNPHEAISELQYRNETNQVSSATRIVMYDWIKQGGQAYVADWLGNVAYVGTAETSSGTKYVRTHADGKWTDNLLSLPEF